AMKTPPSIFLPHQSVDMSTRQPATCQIQGRHAPSIARRAVPVAEAMTAFVLADLLLSDEARRPRVCLTLAEPTIDQALATLKENLPFVEMCELRADFLKPEQLARAADFPSQAGLPVILTLRRTSDGGRWEGDDDRRSQLFATILQSAPVPFAYVDFEDDFRRAELEELARSRGTKIIRSLHELHGTVENIVERACELKGSSDDITKIACQINHCSELARLFRETENFTGFPHIICGMGELGKATRILAVRTHSLLTFTSPAKTDPPLSTLGHLTPATMVRTYRFRSLTAATQLYGVTGWPLEHSLSPELNNEAFAKDACPAVMVPLPAETAREALDCAEALGIRGLAVTVPHKAAMLPLMATLSPEARAVNAVNTVIMTINGWHGENTDIAGFRQALSTFLGRDDLRSCRVAILGAGGAANAVAYAVASLGGEACIFNRTLEKAQALAEKYGFRAAPLASDQAKLLAEYSQIIIQTTSVGLSSLGDNGGCQDPIPFYAFRGDESVFDLIYSPPLTPLLARAQAAGCRISNGLGMLIAQAQEQRRLYKELSRP
ncbi:MAG: type I 3-dehydroquinate dehydratase, partial [Victivallales bacterium]|nr:type I 3-dehydroquinate dehydratase [Victivallales bacterium]